MTLQFSSGTGFPILPAGFHHIPSYQGYTGFQGPQNKGFKCIHTRHGNIANILKLTNTGQTPFIIMFINNGNSRIIFIGF